MKFSRIFILLLLLTSYKILKGNNYTVSGYVKDKNSGEILIGANIFIEGTSIGTGSDKNGFYKIKNIKEGRYIIKTSYIGYKSFSDTITFQDDIYNLRLDFNLNYTTIEGNEVLVTAQAKGQINAINRQLNSKSLLNVISSERINDLPDANAVETIGRVPGVSIKREGGEGNKVIIRGLSPKYNNITVNGVKLASTDGHNRSTDVGMISQYMLDQIEVIKAGTPDNDAEALGGTINFQLKKAKPGGLHGNVIVQGMHNGLRNSYNDNKLVMDLSNRFWNDRIGFFMQIDKENRNRGSHEFEASYSIYGENLDSISPLVRGDFNLRDRYRLNQRENSLQVFDINIPNGNLSYSNMRSKIIKDINGFSHSYGSGRSMVTGKRENKISVNTESFKYKQTLFNKIEIDAFTSYSESKNFNENYGFNFYEDDAYSENTYGKSINDIQKLAKNDIAFTIFQSFNKQLTDSFEKEKAYGVNIKYDFQLTNKISGNFKYGNKIKVKNRKYDINVESGNLDGANYSDYRDAFIEDFDLSASGVYNGNDLSLLSFIDEDNGVDKLFNGKYSFGEVADINLMMKVYRYFKYKHSANSANLLDPSRPAHLINQTESQLYDYSGKENYFASYLMAEIDFGSFFNLITGLRKEVVKTTYFSQQYYEHPFGAIMYNGEDTSHKRKNSNYMPALFLIYKPKDWLNFRFAITNTLTRPSYTAIIPLVRVSGSGRTIDWRNKYLKPGLSRNVDLSVSIHENKAGFFSVGFFQKKIKNLIFNGGQKVITNEDIINLKLDTNLVNYTIENYRSNNLNEVLIRGFEFDYQTRFWYLPSILEGLIFNANYSWIESKVQYPWYVREYDIVWDPFEIITHFVDTTYSDRLLDQPNEIINFSLGYDHKGFSGRLSMLYYDDVFKSTNFWPELRQTTDPYRRWDMSIKQKLFVDGLSIYFNFSNITSTNDINKHHGVTTNDSGSENIAMEQFYGRTIDLGFRYSF